MVWIILGAILLLFWLALLQPVWFHIVVTPTERIFEMKYLWFRLRPSKGGDRSKREKESETEKKSQRSSPWQWRSIARGMLLAIRRAFLYILRRTKLRTAQIEGTLGIDNPMDTGIAYGIYKTIRESIPISDTIQIEIEPDFAHYQTRIWAELEGGLRPSTVISSAVILLWYLPKRKIWRILRA